MVRILPYAGLVVGVLLNQVRRLQPSRSNVTFFLLIFCVMTLIVIRIRDDATKYRTNRGVVDYMLHWEILCKNKTRDLRLNAARSFDDNGSKPLCPCVVQYRSHTSEARMMEELEKDVFPTTHPATRRVLSGGWWKPSECIARQKVALVIPFRNRERHLRILLQYLHPFLQAQLLHYQIFVVEQEFPTIFNRAALMNIGYLEAHLLEDFDCYIFHDVDLIPLDVRNFYSCFRSPLHLGAYMNKFDYEMPYPTFFGGAVAFSAEHLVEINGFSNRYFGWGGEDDDTYNRVLWRNWTVYRHHPSIGKSYMIKHEKDRGNPENPKKDIGYDLQPEQYLSNGLNSISYTAHSRRRMPLYTKFTVSIEKEYLTECIVDVSRHPSEPGNYVECLQEENYKMGTVDCCHDDDDEMIVTCCSKNYGYGTIPPTAEIWWTCKKIVFFMAVLFLLGIFIALLTCKKLLVLDRFERRLPLWIKSTPSWMNNQKIRQIRMTSRDIVVNLTARTTRLVRR